MRSEAPDRMPTPKEVAQRLGWTVRRVHTYWPYRDMYGRDDAIVWGQKDPPYLLLRGEGIDERVGIDAPFVGVRGDAEATARVLAEAWGWGVTRIAKAMGLDRDLVRRFLGRR